MDEEIKKDRLKIIQDCLKYLDENQEAMKVLSEIFWRNASEYSCALNSETSIYNNIPQKLFHADELIPMAEAWDVYKREWYKSIASKYPDTWIPIADFQSGKDELFVDISVKRLPIIVTKFMGRNDLRSKEICDNFPVFIERYKTEKILENINNQLKEILEILKFNDSHWNSIWRNIKEDCWERWDEFSVFTQIPKKLLGEDDLIQSYYGWKGYVNEHYKELKNDFPDSWIPISDYTLDYDYVFVDTMDEKLPVILAKIPHGENIVISKVVCNSLIQCVIDKAKQYGENIPILNSCNNQQQKPIAHLASDNYDVVKAFENAWNEKNVLYIAHYLIPEFRYASQWVLEEMIGSDRYLNYLNAKFKSIKNSGSIVNAKMISGTNAIVITQCDGDTRREAVLVIEVKEGLAYRADLCIPSMAIIERI